MELQQLSLPIKNKFLAEYWSNSEAVKPFFEYDVTATSFEERANYLQSRQYKRGQLANVIEQYMQPFGISDAVAKHLEMLKEGALVVVGGQQSGVLTGPLYSVHKAITVLLLAKQQSEQLRMPVIPLFWIAGEDHDLEEINHTFTIVNSEVKKRGYSERSKYKTMASTTALNYEAMEKLIRTVFADFGETQYTERLLQDVLNTLKQSSTFTSFFTSLMNDLFSNYGLLMLDAAYTPFRQLENDYFEQIVVHNKRISEVVVAKEQALEAAGFGTPILATETNANLFFVREGERFLLTRQGELFVNHAAQIKLTTEELLNIAKQHPEQLSNNVVTRPLMQEMTIPVLAFVGGPGELAYWATLKDAFVELSLQMPIFAPRMNITLVTRKLQPILEAHEVSVADVLQGAVSNLKQQFIDSIQSDEVKATIEQTKQMLAAQYEQIGEQLQQLELSLEKVLVKNEQFHMMQLDFLQTKIEQQLLVKHDVAIRQYELLQSELLPQDGFQERLFSPYYFMNSYGPTLIDDLLQLKYSLDSKHQVVYL